MTEFRRRIFEEYVQTDASGLIVTFVWALEDLTNDYGNANGFLERLINSGRRILGAMMKQRGPFVLPGDPYSLVREPRRRSTGDRHSSIALAEPEPPNDVSAVGRLPPR